MRPVMAKATVMDDGADGYFDFGFIPEYIQVVNMDAAPASNSKEVSVLGIPADSSGSGGQLLAHEGDGAGSITQTTYTSGLNAYGPSRFNADSDDMAFAGVKMVASTFGSDPTTDNIVAFGFRND